MTNARKVCSRAMLLGSVFIAPIVLVSAPASATVQGQALQTNFNIPSQDLGSALTEFARQSRQQLLYSPDLVRGKKSTALVGAYSAEAGLQQLLSGTKLNVSTTSSGAFLLSSGGEGEAGSAAADNGDALPADQVAAPIVVTGSRIANTARQFSPAVSITRSEMDLAGFETAEDFFDTLPQNFGGGATPDTSSPGSIAGPGAAGVNLRGLGNEATLVLLNGRRLPSSGILGSFVDISAIPSALIERIEVVADGASAIYGSDAVAGVANIILRDDFDGAETQFGIGGFTRGGGETMRASQTLGFSNPDNHGVAAYSFRSENHVGVDDRSFSRFLMGPKDFLPSSETHSVFTAGGIEISPVLRLNADAYYSRRDTNGAEWSPFTSSARTKLSLNKYGAALQAQLDLGAEWQVEAIGSFGNEDRDSRFIQTEPSRGVIDRADYEVYSLDATLSGPVFRISGEPAKVVVGGHIRDESLNSVSHPTDTDFNVIPGTVIRPTINGRSVTSFFGEAYIPLVSRNNGFSGMEKFAATVAARYDDYESIGDTFNYKLGLSWEPIRGINLRGTYATSFRAPSLYQARDSISQVLLIYYQETADPSSRRAALRVAGTSKDLDPEEAKVWTIGADIRPSAVPDLRLSGTYFSIDYRGRIGFPRSTPLPGIPYLAYTGAEDRVELDPSSETVNNLVNQAVTFIDASQILPGYPPLNLSDVSAILYAYPTNLSSAKVEGLEIQGNYSQSLGKGLLSISLNATYLTKLVQRRTSQSALENLLNTFGNPVDLRLRAGAQWRQDYATVSMFINHTGDYIDDEFVARRFEVDSWTTLDASVALDLQKLVGPAIGETSLVFAINNLLDADPPTVGRVSGRDVAYDAANAGPGGRQISLLLTKRW